jgi:phosphoserine aminotransferase
MIVLSPRAVKRLETHTPPWPLPKIFRMTKGGKLIDGIFVGETINTPSMLCVEDYIDALTWAKSVGGLKGLMARADANFKALGDWAAKTPWIDFFAEDPATRSNTSICLKVVDPDVTRLDLAGQEAFVRAIAARLDKEGAAYDIAFHRDAPPHFRIWGGATIEAADLVTLTAWLEWGFAVEKANLKQAA